MAGSIIHCHYPIRADIPTLTKPTLTHNHMAQVWETLEQEGKTRWLFYDGQVQTEADFIDFMTEPDVYAYTAYTPDGKTPVALYWLNNFIGNAAMMHFAYTDAGLVERYRIGVETCNFLLRNGGVSALIGITPKPFRHAWQFALEVGYVKKAVVPQACTLATTKGTRLVDAVVTLCTHETLKPLT